MEHNTIEEVVELSILSGLKTGRIDITPPAGEIIRVKIFYAALNNPGIVNASITDDNGKELSKPQHIENYRDRDSGYTDCKPFYHPGGKKLWLNITAKEEFTADFLAQLIFIYADHGIKLQNC